MPVRSCQNIWTEGQYVYTPHTPGRLAASTCYCSFSLRGAASADLAVAITVPETNPATLTVGETLDFTASAILDGEPLDPSALAWEWDFGDKSKLATSNPAPHAYTTPGEYLVTVAGFFGKQSMSAEVTVNVEERQFRLLYPEGAGIIIFSPNEGGQTCDTIMVACAIPRSWFTANPTKHYVGARFYRIVDGQRVRMDDAGETGWLSPEGGWFPWEGVEYKICRLSPPQYTQWWPNEQMDWEADYLIQSMDPPPPPPYEPPPPVPYTAAGSITSNNAVVTSSMNSLIFHYTTPQEHEISWNIAHLAYVYGGPPAFDVTVTVRDMAG